MISVIVPVYNVEHYLPRCIDSILAQTYGQFELILVDDGSTDQSGRICDERAGGDGRIRVFHKKNGGLSDARNHGLDRMRGDYVTFIDSDDYVGRDYLCLLLDMLEENGADMSVVSIQDTYSKELSFIESGDERVVLSGEAIIREMTVQEKLTCSACAKLFKRELFDGVRFPKGRPFEDLLTIPYLRYEGATCVCSTSKQYYYFQRLGSIMHSASEGLIQTWLDAMEQLLNYVDKMAPQTRRNAEYMFVQGVFWRAIDWKLNQDDYVCFSRGVRSRFFTLFCKGPFLPRLTLKERIKTALFLISVRGYRRARRTWIRAIDNPDNRHYMDV